MGGKKPCRKNDEPAVLGHWIGGYFQRNGCWYYMKPYCSICGHRHDGVTPYCEQCGAKMDLKEGPHGR
jgi:hypothetical protein